MEITLDSLQVHGELDPELWDNFKLKPGIRKALLRIAAEFLISLGTEVELSDVTVTGSLANFNYTPASDIDLHIIFDYTAIAEDVDVVKEMLAAKRTLWNLKHGITVKEHEVEVYPQDSTEPHHSTGVYSLIRDDWVTRPRPSSPAVDTTAVSQKARAAARFIDDILMMDDRMMFIPMIREKLTTMRKSGLDSAGEYSVENLVFKILRRHGYLDKLAEAELHDRDVSLSLAQEGNIMKVSKSIFAEILREEFGELENPRHRGGSHERSQAGDFEPPDDLLLGGDDADECDEGCGCGQHVPAHDNHMVLTASEEINSLASKIADASASRSDLPDWVDFKLSSSLTHLRDIYLYLKGSD